MKAWSNISQHALNTVFALFEILFTNIQPPPWLHLPFCIVLLACYLGVAYITRATEGFYGEYRSTMSIVSNLPITVYNFLDPSKQHAVLAGYIIGIAVAECIIFAAIWGVIRLRCKLLSRKNVQQGDQANRESLEEWQEVRRVSMNEV